MTDVRRVVADATEQLKAAGVPSAASDARWLVCHLLGTSPAGLLFAGPVTDDERSEIDAAVTRRAAREPLQHILGTAPFGDLDLAVGPGVFVPRPETEVMAQYALDWLQRLDRRAEVVDACSGSGALALAVACHVPAHVTAIEASDDALQWLARNVTAHADRVAAKGSAVTIVAADVTLSAPWPRPESVDLVVCNPPYIPDNCIPRDPEVRDHDPAMALFGGRDGFDVVRPVIAHAEAVLRPGGLLLIEHADDQGEPEGVPGLIRAHGAFTDVSDHPDWAGRPRFTSALRA